MAYTYDPQNIFAKILRGEIPNNTVLETEHALAFNDINPQAPTHALVIPKGASVNYDDFVTRASEAEIVDFFRAVAEVAGKTGVAEPAGGSGYRLFANAGAHSHQEVPHFHMHVCGGRPLGPLLAKGA
ncbi:MAG: HIT domain-containing protein [Pseudomonadota bacterium]